MDQGPAESSFVFNIVITPGTFRYLSVFTRSLLAHSAVRVRLVANGCPDRELQQMRELESASSGRIVVFRGASEAMVPHGVALDEIYAAHDDGDYFAFMDSDVLAKAPFMETFVQLLGAHDVVTSCNPAWSDDTILPAGARDLVGRHAVGHDGFVYGSSYLAIYRRVAVEQVRERWSVSFVTYAHDRLPPAAQARLV